MPCLCGLRLFGSKRAISSPANVNHEDDEEQPRPYTGSTAVGTSTGTDTSPAGKDKGAGKRSRSGSAGQKLGVPVEALATALRGRARSRAGSASLEAPTNPPQGEEKRLPSLPPCDEKPPRLSLSSEVDPRHDLDFGTVAGQAWPLRDDKGTEAGTGLWQRPRTEGKRASSGGSLDAPSSPDFPDEEKRVIKGLYILTGDCSRDSGLRDGGSDRETKEETEEQERKRKMREARERLKREMSEDEQDRLDMFQCM